MNKSTGQILGSNKRRIQLAVFLIGCIFFGCFGRSDSTNSSARSADVTPQAAPPPPVVPASTPELSGELPVVTSQTDKDYSKFQHGNAFHSRLPCLLCHRRDDNSPRIGFPGRSGHLPCAGCHALQFSDNTSPICTICHTATGMKRFPSLKSFTATFDHGRHTRVNCAVCHKPASRGVALSIPSGGAAHSTCFQCHSASAPSTMSSCNVCHKPGRPNWTSTSARAFSLSFSHSKHVQSAKLSCTVCHSVKAGAPRGRQVSAPLAIMHFAPPRGLSCGGCHNGTRAFGPNDFTNCKRCHQDNSFRFR